MLLTAPYLLFLQSVHSEHALLWLCAVTAFLAGGRLLVRPKALAEMQGTRIKARRPRLIAVQRNWVSCQRSRLAAAFVKLNRTADAPDQVSRICMRTQWQRTAGIVETALQSTQEVNRCQLHARQQLDAAEHALNTLLDDISGIMPLPIESTRPCHDVSLPSASEISSQPLAA